MTEKTHHTFVSVFHIVTTIMEAISVFVGFYAILRVSDSLGSRINFEKHYDNISDSERIRNLEEQVFDLGKDEVKSKHFAIAALILLSVAVICKFIILGLEYAHAIKTKKI